MRLSTVLQLSAAAAATDFPLFLQCDDEWGQDLMGVDGPGERATICDEGCAMSSLSMAVAGLGLSLPDGSAVNPGSVNAWLEANDGYACAAGDCNNLVLTAPEAMTGGALTLWGEQAARSRDEICEATELGDQVALLHVHNSGHFVLATGCPAELAADSIAVNDPFYNETAYSIDDVSDTIVYSLTGRKEYPLFKQCDEQWGDDVMVSETVCQVGCLMSSTAMALNGYGIAIDGKDANPGTLNEWLRNNGGYDDENDFIESSIEAIAAPGRVVWPDDAMQTAQNYTLEDIQHILDTGRVLIANVMAGRHFVGVHDVDEELVYVNDPGFDTLNYTWSVEEGEGDVVGWRIFDMH